MLQDSLGVARAMAAEGWRLRSEPQGANLAPNQGVRREGAILQMGLKKSEIAKLARGLENLLKQVDSGDVKTF